MAQKELKMTTQVKTFEDYIAKTIEVDGIEYNLSSSGTVLVKKANPEDDSSATFVTPQGVMVDGLRNALAAAKEEYQTALRQQVKTQPVESEEPAEQPSEEEILVGEFSVKGSLELISETVGKISTVAGEAHVNITGNALMGTSKGDIVAIEGTPEGVGKNGIYSNAELLITSAVESEGTKNATFSVKKVTVQTGPKMIEKDGFQQAFVVVRAEYQEGARFFALTGRGEKIVAKMMTLQGGDIISATGGFLGHITVDGDSYPHGYLRNFTVLQS